jgi:eukaryotic-like serine/threonine-protein kinase
MNEQEILPTALVQMPSELGRYHVLRRLGRGGMGEVWLCEDPRLRRQIAIKTLPVHAQQDDEFVQRFEREAEAAAALNHPHIVQVHDYGKQALPDETIITYIVMPYIGGGSLAERLDFYTDQHQLIPTQESLLFLSQAAEAIDYAHKKRIVHRDIKPANMLLRDQNWLLLADFGIARILTDAERLTLAGYGPGTPEYMAPEQAQGQATITSDNYSLAVIVYQLFTGRLPFQGETAIATTMQHLLEPPSSPRQFNPTLTPAFEQVLLQGLAKDPEQRPALACEFVDQLKHALQQPAYQITAMQTLRNLPTLHFYEKIGSDIEKRKEEQKSAQRTSISRRQLLTGAGITAATLAGAGLGAWSWFHNIQPNLRTLPTQAGLSARPAAGESSALQLVLSGHVNRATALCWSPDSRALISGGEDIQVLRWDIPLLLQKLDRPYGSPLYSNRLIVNNSGAFDLLLAWSSDGQELALANYIRGGHTQLGLLTPELDIISQVALPDQPSWLDGLTWLPGRHLALINIIPNNNNNTILYKMLAVDSTHLNSPWTLTKMGNGQALGSFYISSLLLTQPDQTSTVCAFLQDQSILVGDFTLTGSQPHWNIRTTIQTGQDQGSLKAIAWAADKTSLVVLTDSGISYYNTQESNPRTHSLEMPTNLADNEELDALTCNSNEKSPMVAIGTTGSDNTSGGSVIPGKIYLWPLRDGASPSRVLEPTNCVGAVVQLAWSPDNRWLAASYDDANWTIAIWKM